VLIPTISKPWNVGYINKNPRMPKVTLAILITFFLTSCKDKPPKASIPTNTLVPETKISDTITDINKVKDTDYTFFSDSVLLGHKAILSYYFNKYGSNTSSQWTFYDRKEIKEGFEGLHYVGNIKNNHINDSVFVLRQGYYFTDTTLPPLLTDSYCCHPSNIFLVGDIDEDGVSEIGQYYSSCASHYKSLHVYSLKNKKWQEIGHCVYDLYYMELGKPYSYFVKKVSKNKFKMLEITDLIEDKTKIGKRNWKQFSM
jgi:hypothetical protein